jgi:hypothetical protein
LLARAALGLLVPAAIVLAGCGGPVGPSGTGAGSLPFDGRSPVEPAAKRMRVLVQLRRPSLATQMRARKLDAAAQRAYVASLGDEARALESALEAKGVRLRRAVLLARVWNGFAATVDARDLPKLRALGLRAEPVRRLYGAASSGGAAPPAAGSPSARTTGSPAVALLDTGVDVRAPGLAGRVVRGYDAAGGRAQPGQHGTDVARVLAQGLGPSGGKIVSVRIAGLQRDRRTGSRVEAGTTDQLLAGLERTVDPDGDGDTSDHIPVALVGMNSPYAGFADSPDAVGASAARALGTLVVAPAGNEGRGGGSFGTVGSPAAAAGVVAVGALDGGGGPALPSVRVGMATAEGRALLRGTVLGGGGGSARGSGTALRAPIANLAGPSQENPRERGRALGGTPLEYFAVDAKPRARGRAAVVPARTSIAPGPSIAARAAAAAEAGAGALIVCEPDTARPLAAIPRAAADIPVIGLRGEAARKALDLTRGDSGGVAFISAPRPEQASKPVVPAPPSSRGPAYSLAPKPDLAAPGTARLDGRLVAGTSIAAARVAAAVAVARARNPSAKPDDLAAAVTGTARPFGPPTWTGAGVLDSNAAASPPLLIEPFTLGLDRIPVESGAHPATPGLQSSLTLGYRFVLKNPTAQPAHVTVKGSLPGRSAKVTPPTLDLRPHARKALTFTIDLDDAAKAGFVTGSITATKAGARPVRAVVGLPVGPPPPAKLGPLTLVGKTGVRFTAGALTESGGLRTVEPLGVLRLELTNDKGKVVRELTPPGGARDLLPGEYAYTLTKAARKALTKGTYSFTARAKGPAGGPEAEQKSASFTIR